MKDRALSNISFAEVTPDMSQEAKGWLKAVQLANMRSVLVTWENSHPEISALNVDFPSNNRVMIVIPETSQQLMGVP